MPDIVVAIPTKGRPDRLRTALSSVAMQTMAPSQVLVVGDDSLDWAGIQSTGAVFLVNRRAKNVSGALNTALAHLILCGVVPDATYVAFLDDDDTWEETYLEKAVALADKIGSDLVYSGIVRHEEAGDVGIPLSIAQGLTVSQFLAGNPHVQGSNMVVRLSALLRAGGFDEHLPSTTDRDLCIRLLDLGNLKCGAVAEHLVHYWATDHPRLSSPGSERKSLGLQAFWNKHGPRMTEEERASFLERAETLFSWKLSEANVQGEDTSPANPSPPVHARGPVQLVVGFTATWLSSAATLLGDIAKLNERLGGIARLLVCDNSSDTEALVRLVAPLNDRGMSVRLVPKAEIEREAALGRFGSYYETAERRRGIAYGRTVLHHYLYAESQGLRHAVFWILDDDVRIDRLLFERPPRELDGVQFLDMLRILRAEGCDVGVGSIYGDPPLPAASLVRTQLLDLLYALQAFSNAPFGRDIQEAKSLRTELMRAYPDYYYDQSVRHGGHLETPLPCIVPAADQGRAAAFEALLKDGARLAGGIGVFRPIEAGHETAAAGLSGVPVRGGNTLVFDRECLKTYPNVAPRIGDVDSRRGDTVWCMLNARIGGVKVHHREKRVVAVPLHVRQERQGFDPSELSLKPLLADIFGGAFMRAFDVFLTEKLRSLGPMALPRDVLHFSEEEVRSFLTRFDELVSTRSVLFEMNAWRICGLVEGIQVLLRVLRGRDDELGQVVRRHESSLLHLLDCVGEVFSARESRALSERARNYPREDLIDFLRGFSDIRSSYSHHLPVTADATDIESAEAFLRDRLGVENPRFIGEGNEGLVFTDGVLAYKYFHHGTMHFLPGQIEFLHDAFSKKRGWNNLTPLEDVVVGDERVVFVRRLVEGEVYRGGHLADLLGLLRECRRNGIVLTNLTPGNIVVGPEGLKYVDLGISTEPYDPSRFRETCKRAYLVYRWHFRQDLKSLLTRALRDDSLPELFGVEHFLAALDHRSVGEVLHPVVLGVIHELGVREVFDYGCGGGSLTGKLVASGLTVTGLDPDETALAEAKRRVPEARFLDADATSRLQSEGATYPAVLCNLVLCTIPDDEECERVLADLRRLAASDGRIVVAVCSPFALEASETQVHKRGPQEAGYAHTQSYEETVEPRGQPRMDVHRPLHRYLALFRRAGLELERLVETAGTDVPRLSPASDFLILVLRPLPRLPTRDISLLIKVSAMEWRTIGMQVRHLVHQLEGPQRFVEKVVVTDDYLGPYARPYDEPNFDALARELERLRAEGTIDRVVIAPREVATVRATLSRWFGLECAEPRSENGQPTFTTLYGLDACSTEYVLQVDSDCLVGRLDRSHDYLGELLRVFDQDPDAVTVTLPVPSPSASPFTRGGDGAKWRTEVRCCLLSRSRLARLLPLPNALGQEGLLARPWHRALDEALAKGPGQSYRGGDPRTYFIHVPNDRKKNPNAWYNILRALEGGHLPAAQIGRVDLVGGVEDWLGKRTGEVVFLVRGRNVPIPQLMRCVESLEQQRDRSWGVVFIDAGSDNGMEEYLAEVVTRRLGSQATLYRNLIPVTPLENMRFAVGNLCGNPQSIIVTVDADDALIGDDVVNTLREAYDRGADVTVGSMLRTDKAVDYPVWFDDPRGNRGGNVWQHLRTFRKYLFDLIPDEYLKVNGEWVPFAEDWAFMLPIVEMAENPVHIERPLYFHEPSAEKAARPRGVREEAIGAIVGKAPLGKAML